MSYYFENSDFNGEFEHDLALLEADEQFEFYDEETVDEGQGEVNRRSRNYIRWVQRSLNQILGLRLAEDGRMGSQTRSAIRSFQRRRGLTVDAIVGSRTEKALIAAGASPPISHQAPPTSSTLGKQSGVSPKSSPGLLDRIVQVAAHSKIARYRWRDRGVAPIGYIKGMALVYAKAYCKLKSGDAAAMEMAKANTGNAKKDVLAHFAPEFNALGMPNQYAGIDTLRHLFVLMIGLGMRESSGKYCEGRDRSASNTRAETAEAGLFQTSYNASGASPLMPMLFRQYRANPSGFLEIFKEGVRCKRADFENFGQGNGREFQRLSKECPAFAVEFTAIGLRNRRAHWGPINRKKVEIHPECDAMLKQVEKVVDGFNLCSSLNRSSTRLVGGPLQDQSSSSSPTKGVSKKGPLSYENLNHIWDKYRPDKNEDCLKSAYYIANLIAKQFGDKAQRKLIKKFKQDVLKVAGDEHKQATERFKKGKVDALGDSLVVYHGYSNSLRKQIFPLKPGMLVYTSEYVEWLKEKDPKTGRLKYVSNPDGKRLIRWSKRHVRMYIGRGEFRDNLNYWTSRTGKPVWGGKRLLYVVLAVYDPFFHLR